VWLVVAGLIELYRTVQEPKWLRWAQELTTTQIDLFWDEKTGGFFESLPDPLVAVRLRNDHDGAEPAANSVAAENLIRLGRLTDNNEWLQLADKTINSFDAQLDKYPQALPCLLNARQELLATPHQVVIAGGREAEDTHKMLSAVFRSWHPDRILLLADEGENQQLLETFFPFIKEMTIQDKQSTAYICRDFTCQAPVVAPDELVESLKSQKRQRKKKKN
ncbi:MAG: thioredoxin domain-containing protein, partial [Candidatus Electrothrix sp. AR4]|nr:thioredoxin domain-containing protein [Candidatus Electrothrix sp. AR4]